MSYRKTLLYKVAVAGLLSALINLGFAEGEAQKGVEVHGFVQMQGGQFVKYKYLSIDYMHRWLQRNLLGFNLNAHVNPRLDVYLTTGALLTFNTQSYKTIFQPDNFTNAPITGLILDRAEMVIHCSPDPAKKLLDIGIGLWNEKYNPEARDLGEYLFRSGAYPGYIYQSGFDECFLNLAGIRLNSDLFGMWHNELLLTSELQMTPFNDFSLAYLTDVSLFQKVLTLGGGIQLFRCLSADPEQTSPQGVWQNGTMAPAPAPNYYLDSIGLDGFGNPLYDTSYYTFAGTKVMLRLMFDPKPLLGLDIFGKEDLKLYGEAAILGVGNYPSNAVTDNTYTSGRPLSQFGYDTLIQKMPMMFGFNFPAFKLLDVLSLECEYYGKKYPNSVPIPRIAAGSNGYYPATCLPALRTSLGGSGEYDSLYTLGGAVNWKWAVYAKKTLFDNFSITAQAARDHILNITKGLSAKETDREEALVQKNQWYWMLKFSANF